MTDTQSEPHDPESRSVDAEARFLKSLSAVFKDNRDVLTRLPELMEQCLNKEPLNPNLVESRHEDENRERELKKRDELLEESERKAKCLEEECLKLKKELEKKEKEISETGKVQEERISAAKNESEKKVKETADKAQLLESQLLKEKDELQRMYGEYEKALKTHKSSNDSMINELAAKDKKIQEYMQRLASLSEKRVKQDQRLVEDTLGLNRQSELEREFSQFFDAERVDACEKMQLIYQNKEDTYLFVYYPRLACIILETAYEQVKEVKEAASDLFQKLIKSMIDLAPEMGQKWCCTRKSYIEGQHPTRTVPIGVNLLGDGSDCSKDIMDGVMLSLKEAAHTCSLDYLVNIVSTIVLGKWEKWCVEDKSCMFTPACHLMQDLDKYVKACIRLTWKMVTQVPPMKLEFHSSKLNKDIHKNLGYHNSFKRHPRKNRPAPQDQDEEIACYLWPGLQDGGGRLVRPGEVICKVEEQ